MALHRSAKRPEVLQEDRGRVVTTRRTAYCQDVHAREPAAPAHLVDAEVPDHAVSPEPFAAHLAELEAAGWKDDRRFRVLTVDRGTLSFSDLYFNTPTKVLSRV